MYTILYYIIHSSNPNILYKYTYTYRERGQGGESCYVAI